MDLVSVLMGSWPASVRCLICFPPSVLSIPYANNLCAYRSCLSSACGGNGLSSYVASVTSDLNCQGTPTDAPIIAAGAVEGNTPGGGMAPRETGAALAAAGAMGIAALLL